MSYCEGEGYPSVITPGLVLIKVPIGILAIVDGQTTDNAP